MPNALTNELRKYLMDNPIDHSRTSFALVQRGTPNNGDLQKFADSTRLGSQQKRNLKMKRKRKSSTPFERLFEDA